VTVLVDTGVVYADHDTDAASTALNTVYDGAFGAPYISDYVFDEAVTLARARTGSHAAATRLADRLRGRDGFPDVYELLRVSAAVFRDALAVFDRYDDQQLSVTDATSVALVDRHDLDQVLSFDDDFDGVVDRVDPASV